MLCIYSAPEEDGSDSERWQELMVSRYGCRPQVIHVSLLNYVL